MEDGVEETGIKRVWKTKKRKKGRQERKRIGNTLELLTYLIIHTYNQIYYEAGLSQKHSTYITCFIILLLFAARCIVQMSILS